MWAAEDVASAWVASNNGIMAGLLSVEDYVRDEALDIVSRWRHDYGRPLARELLDYERELGRAVTRSRERNAVRVAVVAGLDDLDASAIARAALGLLGPGRG